MSDEKLNHENGKFEPQDLSAKGVLAFLVGLVVVCVLVYVVVAGMYRFLNRYQKAHEPAQNPLVQVTNTDTRHPTPADANKFPLPRLETNERGQLNDQRYREEETLNTYGWLDQKAGVAHIPIQRAMELIVERGLPTVPQPATATVAEHEADHGNGVRKATESGGRTPANRQ
jgi:hypothetical protein